MRITELRQARLGVTASLLLLTIGVVALGGFSVGRKVASFQPVGVAAEAVDGELRVLSANENSELLPDDIVVLVNGERPLSLDELAELLLRRSESDLFVLRETEGGEELVSARHGLPGLVIDWAYLALSLTGIGYLLIGLYTLTRQRSRQTLLFHLWALLSAALYLLTPIPPYDGTDRLFFLVDGFCRLLLPPLTLHFFLVFPERPGSPWVRRLIPALYLPATVLLVSQLDAVLGANLLPAPTAASIAFQDRAELVLLVAYALAGAAVLGKNLLARESWEQGRQTQWIAFGVAGGYLPFLLLYVVPFALELSVPAWLDVAAVTPLALVPLSFAYALLRYRLWDIKVITRDIATYALTVLLAVLGFSLLSLLIRRGVPQDMVIARGVLNAGAALVVGTLAIPVKNGLGRSLERLQYRAQQSRRALERLGAELVHERDLDRLASSLLRELEEGLGLERSNLYLVEGTLLAAVRPEPETTVFRLADTEDSLWSEPYRALVDAPLADADLPLSLRLSTLGYRYVFPLTVRERRVGLLYVGHHSAGAPLSSDDLTLIRQLLNQAALAIENAQLLEQRQRQLDRVSELRQFSEEIIESSPAGIAVVDGASRIVTVNGAFADLMGHTREKLKGRALGTLIPLELFPHQGEPPAEVEFVDLHQKQRHLQLSSAEFQGAADARQVVVVHDISERVAMKRKLAENERLAALGAMAAGVAHEVNTPLTGISSYAQMLLSDTSERDPRRRLLKKVERQTFRAARIVNTLLDFARHGQHESGPVDLAVTIRESCDALAERFAETGVDVEIDLPAGLAIGVLGNDVELGQVFTNLMLNAVDAMTEGNADSRRLKLTVSCSDDNVAVFVDDTGPGIPERHLERVFEPFFSTRKTSGGAGLGLSISQEIVRRHGGELVASNLGGGGCRFALRLPRTTDQAPQPKENAR